MPKKEGLTQPVNIRYSKYVRERVKQIANETGLLQSQVFDYVLAGALEALEGEKGLRLPVKLKVDKSEH
jgi:antitoxin component of RelBE/YafQ-DinJ toxin-antitoxin module